MNQQITVRGWSFLGSQRTHQVKLGGLGLLLAAAVACEGAVPTTVGYRDQDATPAFTFTNVPAPAKTDAGAAAKVRVLFGVVDANSGGLGKLQDGQWPAEADQPDENFFFEAGTEGGRLLMDLERVLEVKQINTYSRHPDARGPQVYKVYGSDGTAAGFVERPQRAADLAASGWRLIAAVDTRTQFGRNGGQYGVSLSEPDGILGKFRYLLFDLARTEADDDFGNTFYSEIDVIDANGTQATPAAKSAGPLVVKSADGYCEITIDTSGAPDLTEWAERKLAPVLVAWYPKIVALMPSEGFEAPKSFSVSIRPGDGVAATGGTRISANANWLQNELQGEALGAIVHEVVHVVQQYGGGRQRNSGGSRPPGWLVEGIPDYVRFFLYEPQIHGADLYWVKGRRNLTLNYDGRYRISANFLNYVVEKYDRNQTLFARVNAACRDRKYSDSLWSELTGKSLAELNDEWKAAVQQQLAALGGEGANILSATEQAAGWKLLFNGKDFTGWSNFKKSGVRPGWQVKDGTLVCADPHDAGDLVSSDKFGAFELQLDYNITPGGNSGIIYHVTEEGGAVWATGPEFQLEDNAKAADPQRCGWLYALYQPAVDPRTEKPVDATLPAGQWNHVRLVISPERCEHWINGVKYFDYVIGSEDFLARVKASKFAKMPLFAKSGAGAIALQGDHGQISFRNIKVLPLPAKPATH